MFVTATDMDYTAGVSSSHEDPSLQHETQKVERDMDTSTTQEHHDHREQHAAENEQGYVLSRKCNAINLSS